MKTAKKMARAERDRKRESVSKVRRLQEKERVEGRAKILREGASGRVFTERKRRRPP
jgi:hypothetical protein